MTKVKPMPLFGKIIVASGLPEPSPEYVFARPRKYRFDLAWPNHAVFLGPRLQRTGQGLLALEIEGGTWGKKLSRHSTGSGFEADAMKYAEALLLGWYVLRVTTKMIHDGRALSLLMRAFGRE